MGNREGWWEVPAFLPLWTCPACGEPTDPERWIEVEVACDLCGSHDGRQCPNCRKGWDHVYGAPKIAKASER